jgi:hypothetical protein
MPDGVGTGRPPARPSARRAAGARPSAPSTPPPPTPPATPPGSAIPPVPADRRIGRGRVLAFAAVVLVALAGATGYVLRQASDRSQAEQAAASADARTPRLDPARVLAVPHLVLRNTALGPSYGRVVLVPLANPAGPRAVTDTTCDRVYATAAGGICLAADRGAITTYAGHVLDASLRPTAPVKITGSPSRARMSADSAYVASTVFVAGHSYTDVGFSTVTEIVETASGRSLGNLETWRIIKDGRRYRSADVNFWGTTFGRDGTFYATMASRGRTYLVRGDIATREVATVRENAECPSLSPDGRLVVYKKATGTASARLWRFTVLDLAAGTETPLPETRSIDDQVAWLDNSHVLYAVPRGQAGSGRTDVWASPVPPLATGSPRLLAPDAESPASVP